jgi:hypothetical protein
MENLSSSNNFEYNFLAVDLHKLAAQINLNSKKYKNLFEWVIMNKNLIV